MLTAIKKGSSDGVEHKVTNDTVAEICSDCYKNAIAKTDTQFSADIQHLNNIYLLAHFLTLRSEPEIRRRILWSVNNLTSAMKLKATKDQALLILMNLKQEMKA